MISYLAMLFSAFFLGKATRSHGFRFFNSFLASLELAQLKLMKRSNLLPQLFEESYDRSFEVFRSVRSADIAEHNKDQLPYLLAYSIGGMNSMLIKWIEGGMSIPSSTLILCLREGLSSEMKI